MVDNFIWLVVVSLGLGGPTELLAALSAPVDLHDPPALTRLTNDRPYAASADYPTTKIPVVQVRAEGSGSGSEELMAAERIGEFKIGSSASSILQRLGVPQAKSKEVFSEHDARYHQSWHYPKQGITFGMVADRKGDKPTVDSIKITRPATLATSRGLKIGDSYDTVVREYGRPGCR
jgi:hypothetical protein